MTAVERLHLDSRASEADSLVCSLCGYGVARAEPPDRCPMCQERDAWVQARPRPFARSVHAGRDPAA